MASNAIIIIGASAAGISAAREIRAINSDIPVRIFTEENHYPYYRPMLTEYIGDNSVEKRANFLLNPEKWYGDKKIELFLGQKVTAIDPSGKTIETASGQKHSFGALILANGSSPFVPFKDATGKSNVYSVRTLDDARAVRSQAETVKSAIVIGGGLLGLEAANSLMNGGITVTVIEGADRILPRQLDPECSAIFKDLIARKNVTLIIGKAIEGITGGETAKGVRLATGEEIPAEMIVISIGVRPNVDLAKQCGIQVNRAVVVNERMETSIPGIFACGDVAEFNGKNIALWMPAMRQGKVAGSNAAGKPAQFADEVYPAVLNSFGTKIFSVGDICLEKKEGEYRQHFIKDSDKGNYKKMFFVDDKLAGIILIGDISESQKLTAAIKAGTPFGDVVN
jgi:nitrite reductase (NADH) large subunit